MRETFESLNRSAFVVALLFAGSLGCEGPLNPKACENHPNPDDWCGAGMYCFRNSVGSICRPLPDAGSDAMVAGGNGGRADSGLGGSGGWDGALSTGGNGAAGMGGNGSGPGTGGTTLMPDASVDLLADQSQPSPDVVNPPDTPPSCTSACTAGATRCSTMGVQSCAVQPNGCTAWGTSTACPAPQTCPAGKTACECPAANACTTQGALRCAASGASQTCLRNGSCLEWASEVPCEPLKTCRSDMGTSSCVCALASCSQGSSCARDAWTFDSGTTEGVFASPTMNAFVSNLTPRTLPNGAKALGAEVSFQGTQRVAQFLLTPCSGRVDLRGKKLRANIMIDGVAAPTEMGVGLDAEGRTSTITLGPTVRPTLRKVELLTGQFPQDLEAAEVKGVWVTFLDISSSGWTGSIFLDDLRIEN
jgi:hypothetical protein